MACVKHCCCEHGQLRWFPTKMWKLPINYDRKATMSRHSLEANKKRNDVLMEIGVTCSASWNFTRKLANNEPARRQALPCTTTDRAGKERFRTARGRNYRRNPSRINIRRPPSGSLRRARACPTSPEVWTSPSWGPGPNLFRRECNLLWRDCNV